MENTERERLFIAWKNYSFGGWYQLAEGMYLMTNRVLCAEYMEVEP